MTSVKKDKELTSDQQMLFVAHVAELDMLTKVYQARLAEFQTECTKELASLRRKRCADAAKILFQFQENYSASHALFKSNVERLERGESTLRSLLRGGS